MTSNPETIVQNGPPTRGDFPQGESGNKLSRNRGSIDTSNLATPKRLVVCCDGTWQSSVSGLKNIPSNVTRLARSIADHGMDANGRVCEQIVYYDSGIGTGELSKGEKDRQGGFGIGFVGNVIEAYNFIVLNYQPGDQIFCFGFSRGAYTARAVAGLINDVGVISPRALQDFPELYALYQKHEDAFTFRKSTAYREWAYGVLSAEQPRGDQEPARYDKPPHGDAPESSRVVEVVGVFDTVGSLGIPDMMWTKWNLKFLEKVVGIPQVGFHNVALSPYIRHAFHALAVDEHRKPFSPTLWQYPTDDELCPEKPAKPYGKLCKEWENVTPSTPIDQVKVTWSSLIGHQMSEHLEDLEHNKPELLQVWFPGVHINIGGGSDDLLKDLKGDLEQIALISFAWMCEQIAPYLQLRGGNLSQLAKDTVEDRYNLMRPALDSVARGDKDYGSHWLLSKARAALDYTGIHTAQPKKVADDTVYGWAIGPIVDSFTGAMMAAGSEDRTPGRYPRDTTSKKAIKSGDTNEMIHPSVGYRKEKRRQDYDPPALKGFERKQSGPEGFIWTNGKTTIPEYKIKPADVFTRYIAGRDKCDPKLLASNYFGSVDRVVGQKAVKL
ncbi:hypothetical protein PFICI_05773 [Pestalotiopsis fici W106-1]|uniref:T6SS Phospholipase effector Tle1-like catalytic domain-containing protein n=1 Tax=Pestalotiopsis fici (strain W106-1 / CGMCC3.15140) TaxID=1229662 RepID=W3XER6_PESFW|nr:uncharacterized protein PFICI_05773 [Pestalotiopsis fici W106-1]ETS83897.1 hypothetical protein PFICI_05773 [Pestalotiopsis fici W106-1]